MPKKDAKTILKAILEAPSLPREGPMKNPPHMGSFIRTEILEPLGLTVSQAAKILGVGRPALSNLLNGKASLSPEMALRIEKAFGPDHPDIAQALNNLAALYGRQGRNAQAERLFKRSAATFEKTLGPDHPDLAGVLENLAGLYKYQGRHADAQQVLKRSMAIRGKTRPI